MNSKMINNKIWTDILKLEDIEIDEYINEEMLFLLENTNMSEKNIRNKFKILNNYSDNEKNIMHQRIVLYKIRKYKNNLINKNK